jgi:hypothetical protein
MRKALFDQGQTKKSIDGLKFIDTLGAADT